MKIVRFRKNFKVALPGGVFKIKKGQDYIFSEIIYAYLLDSIKRLGLKERSLIQYAGQLEETFPVLDVSKVEDPGDTEVVIVRTGGIGDLIALSSMVKLLRDRGFESIKFVSQKKYENVFYWFEEPIRFVPYFSPIGKKRAGKVYSVFFEGVIEASKVNWFELQARVVNVEYDPSYGRPFLRDQRLNRKPSNINQDIFSILINPRSTAIIRSMMLRDMYVPIEKAAKEVMGEDFIIYVHIRNLTRVDVEYIEREKPRHLRVIKADSLEKFFLDSFDVDFAVCVDTSLMHFREGIKKHCLGVYGPFPLEARTRDYRYTRSFNVESPCRLMPCFIHTKTITQVCPVQKNLYDRGAYPKESLGAAPCLSSFYNETLQDQIYVKAKEYLSDIVSSGTP